jgi:uncharacterized repeat protein (TIGR01451 family)
MKRTIIVFSAIVLALAAVATVAVKPASAGGSATNGNGQYLACGTTQVSIPDTTVRGPSGSVHLLARLLVPGDLKGHSVTVTAQAVNNESVRSGSNIIIASDGTSFTLNDVESSDGKVTTSSGVLTLGDNVDFSVQLGPKGIFSGGGNLTVSVDCSAAPPPSKDCSVDVAVTKTADKAQYQVGDSATYTVSVANVEQDWCTATNVHVQDSLPAQFTATSVSDSRCAISGSPGAQILTCELGDLQTTFTGAQPVVFTVSGHMTAASDAVSNQACAYPKQADSNESNNCSTVVVKVTAPPQTQPAPTPVPKPKPKAHQPVVHKPVKHHPKPHHTKKHHPKAHQPKAPHYTP